MARATTDFILFINVTFQLYFAVFLQVMPNIIGKTVKKIPKLFTRKKKEESKPQPQAIPHLLRINSEIEKNETNISKIPENSFKVKQLKTENKSFNKMTRPTNDKHHRELDSILDHLDAHDASKLLKLLELHINNNANGVSSDNLKLEQSMVQFLSDANVKPAQTVPTSIVVKVEYDTLGQVELDLNVTLELSKKGAPGTSKLYKMVEEKKPIMAFAQSYIETGIDALNTINFARPVPGYSKAIVDETNLDEPTDENKGEKDDDDPDNDDNGEFNILLLGETGAGKSTTINAFANYLKYKSFEEAKQGEFKSLIPSEFMLSHPITGQSIKIKTDSSHENERTDGNSSTQAPFGYTFQNDQNQTIRLIDTPGMCDTRGTEIDKGNFEQILNFLSRHKRLHGICILIQSHNTRMSATFRYSITQLLAYLHKSACKNIFVCFTFSRISFYGPGDSFGTLKEYLRKDFNELDFKLTEGENCFFIDNEAYRFLVAKKNNFPFSQEDEQKFKESWIKSEQNTRLMIDKMLKLSPHNLTQTKLLNDARKLALLLAEPIVLIQKNLEINIQKINSYKDQLIKSRNYHPNKTVNVGNFYINELELVKLKNAQIVCTEWRCLKLQSRQDSQHTVCHDICEEIKTLCNLLGSLQFKKCTQFNGDLCLKCGCNFKKHMYVMTEYKPVKYALVELFRKNYSQYDFAVNVEKFLQIKHDEAEQLLITIQNVSAELGLILKVHSTTSDNLFLEPFLNKKINEETQKISNRSDYSAVTKALFEKMKSEYKERIAHDHSSANLKDVSRLRNKLAQISPLGQLIKNAKEFEMANDFKYLEKSFDE